MSSDERAQGTASNLCHLSRARAEAQSFHSVDIFPHDSWKCQNNTVYKTTTDNISSRNVDSILKAGPRSLLLLTLHHHPSPMKRDLSRRSPDHLSSSLDRILLMISLSFPFPFPFPFERQTLSVKVSKQTKNACAKKKKRQGNFVSRATKKDPARARKKKIQFIEISRTCASSGNSSSTSAARALNSVTRPANS